MAHSMPLFCQNLKLRFRSSSTGSRCCNDLNGWFPSISSIFLWRYCWVSLFFWFSGYPISDSGDSGVWVGAFSKMSQWSFKLTSWKNSLLRFMAHDLLLGNFRLFIVFISDYSMDPSWRCFDCHLSSKVVVIARIWLVARLLVTEPKRSLNGVMAESLR